MLEEGPIRVEVKNEEGLEAACTDFTRKIFRVLKRPGVELHPRALLRAVVDGQRRQLCPHSWPTPNWARAVIEQVVMDTSGMQPRFLHNDLPWLMQPSLYVDAVMTVQGAKSVVDEWVEDNKKKKE